MQNNKPLHFLGYAFDAGAAKPGSAEGPVTIQHSSYLSLLRDRGIDITWDAMIQSKHPKENKLSQVIEVCDALAEATRKLTSEKKAFVVLGGDHTSAIGTWSGAAHAKREEGTLGLIWIDAHMDSHTVETSPTGNLHGMPVACLLGHGEKSLTTLCDDLPKFHPEHICMIGIRSFEEGEAHLLKKLNVKIFYMDEVLKRGMKAVLADAVKLVSENTAGYGISIDIDSMDPADAPGTGVAESGGIAAKELCSALTLLANDPRLIGVEIAEFDPKRDRERMTEKLVIELLSAILCYSER